MNDQREERRATPPEVRLDDATVRAIEERIASAVSKAVRDSITEETATAFWTAGFDALQRHATQHAGRFVIGGLFSVAKRMGLFLTLGGLVYAVGGWTALSTLFKALFFTGGAQ